jgi:hypothetical protein
MLFLLFLMGIGFNIFAVLIAVYMAPESPRLWVCLGAVNLSSAMWAGGSKLVERSRAKRDSIIEEIAVSREKIAFLQGRESVVRELKATRT